MIEIAIKTLEVTWDIILLFIDSVLFGMIIVTLCVIKYTTSTFLREKGISFLILLIILLIGRWVY